MSAYSTTVTLLETLKLKGIIKSLDEVLNDAEVKSHSHLSFLQSLLSLEIANRRECRLKRNMAAAHFPVLKNIEAFKFGKVKGITKTDISQLLDFHWLDNHSNLLFFGPPGLGKTHLSIALGVKAIEHGYTVSFEKIVNLVRLLKTQDLQRTSGFRIKKILKSDLLIIDEIGYTPIEKREANLLFNLVSDLYEKKSIILTSNKSFDSWAEMMGDAVMTTALLDRLLHHSKVFNLDGESFRIQNKEEVK